MENTMLEIFVTDALINELDAAQRELAELKANGGH